MFLDGVANDDGDTKERHVAKGNTPAPRRAGTEEVAKEISALVLHLEQLGADNPAGLVACLILLDARLEKSRDIARGYKID